LRLPALGDIHDRYLALARLGRESAAPAGNGGFGGKLLLLVGFDADGIAVLIAAGLAGAAALCVDPDPELLREGLRRALCHFLVADLGEALRILKNEIRRQRAVSVCVAADPGLLLAEMAERGVQPDLLSIPSSGSLPTAVFRERGAISLPEVQADPGTERVEWSIETDAARILPRLAHLAAAALDEQREDTPARRHWLANAPRWLGRSWAGQQCVRMTPAEAQAFTQLARQEFPALSLARNSRIK
jgi:Urocanase Rossmann-like domain